MYICLQVRCGRVGSAEHLLPVVGQVLQLREYVLDGPDEVTGFAREMRPHSAVLGEDGERVPADECGRGRMPQALRVSDHAPAPGGQGESAAGLAGEAQVGGQGAERWRLYRSVLAARGREKSQTNLLAL